MNTATRVHASQYGPYDPDSPTKQGSHGQQHGVLAAGRGGYGDTRLHTSVTMASRYRRVENPFGGENGDIADSSPHGYGAPYLLRSRQARMDGFHPMNQGCDIDLDSWDHSSSSHTHSILEKYRDVDCGIDNLEHNIEEVRIAQQRVLNDADSSVSSEANSKLQSLSSKTMTLCHQLTDRVRALQSDPNSDATMNRAQAYRIGRRLKHAIKVFQQVKHDFRKRTKDQMARQYRIVRPTATEDEVRAAVEYTPGNKQIFSEELLQRTSQGRARAALSEVQYRHQALANMEQQMAELVQLFQSVDTLVVRQDEHVKEIDTYGTDAADNMNKGNAEISAAIVSARKRRRKKWICLGICIVTAVLTAIVVLVYILTNHARKTK